ncbi:Thiosulfate reductase cytochrome b subunit [Mariniphaga anaerophila]|uniref:Thiosulfate reductase cytochrome b subunit n=1 Tax=Mariniphaga anaerophila TaxID=1484053 RepID=A0A1M5AAP5_9BACT|nr:cytochrome b/b6 domain-containing protein [Mariniphaga anaerophila]SHF27390.1 Thiosulfate reductase cytochrome b subunit [Mariniphaga anaerophila]
MKRVYVYKGFERFWHWTQASLIIFLAFTGFEVHGTFHVLGFEHAARFHRVASWMLISLIIFAIFWHVVTGEWRQYIPTTKKLLAQIRFYSIGMFKGEKHPTKKTEVKKLNPLQRLVYLGFKLVLVPVTVISGIIYMFHKTIDRNDIVMVSDFSLETVAFWHTLGAFLLMVFLVVHVYMTTTGHTPTSNIQAMITGYEDLEDDAEESEQQEVS